MPPRRSPTLTEAELRLMEVLWEKGPASVHQLQQSLPAELSLAYNSVLTTIRILEKKATSPTPKTAGRTSTSP